MPYTAFNPDQIAGFRMMELAELINQLQHNPDIITKRVSEFRTFGVCDVYRFNDYTVTVTGFGGRDIVTITNVGLPLTLFKKNEVVGMVEFISGNTWNAFMTDLRRWVRNNYGELYREMHALMMESIKRMPAKPNLVDRLLLKYMKVPITISARHLDWLKILPGYRTFLSIREDGSMVGSCLHAGLENPIPFVYKLGDDLRIHYARIFEQVYGV